MAKTPPLDPDRCDEEVFRRGEAIGVFVMERGTAESLVTALRDATGDRWDWNFAAGRVVLRVLRAAPPTPTTPPREPLPTQPEFMRMLDAYERAAARYDRNSSEHNEQELDETRYALRDAWRSALDALPAAPSSEAKPPAPPATEYVLAPDPYDGVLRRISRAEAEIQGYGAEAKPPATTQCAICGDEKCAIPWPAAPAPADPATREET